jgi:hypothetical protein
MSIWRLEDSCGLDEVTGWWRWSTQNESIIRNTRNVVRAIQFKVRAATTPIVRLFA